MACGLSPCHEASVMPRDTGRAHLRLTRPLPTGMLAAVMAAGPNGDPQVNGVLLGSDSSVGVLPSP